METSLTGAWVLSVAGPFLFHRFYFQPLWEKLHNASIVRTNYRGEKVVTAGGVFLISYAAAVQLLLLCVGSFQSVDGTTLKQGLLLLAGSLAMACCGWLDDRSTDKIPKGFRGHFGVLLREGRLTSGVWKAAGGAGTALVVSSQLHTGIMDVWVGAGVLALSSNLLNLFDVRPARAIKVFWLVMAGAACSLLLYAESTQLWIWVLPVLTSTLLLFPHDAHARLMLGDTGANYLGFIAGFVLTVTLPFFAQLAVLALWLGLHLLSEYVSFTRLIAQVGWLNRLDEWGRPMETK
ncbi:UDP-N-acetylmuramyl pentapeptide phosphotransferase [Brevibacillus ruminantium]|uniref:UDP-N-acetylmuramyl pentapeptide phosphotransferase n=1 Tax=Brevibacillus ruminantium TaxID=2950604 RepID=A0ABY4WE84_9BACL|nr:UDP-N-acetylmuramyl pentapeptide phosphotransferase [Brevibacillus ruminantium]USG63619.1 UDP-N-acetylmuramyl pentapeptide phosphotransferase [Brevibacillus ruminantium]